MSKRLAVVGTGYVGLVAGACLADSGHEVICVDSDLGKIEALRRGEIPIYEEGLADVVERCVRMGRLSFQSSLSAALDGVSMVFVAVGTPSRADGEADLSAVFEVARAVGKHAKAPLLLILKSTVPVGTNRAVSELLESLDLEHPVEVANNPEFLKEGAAIADFRRPDRVVLGVRSKEAEEALRQLYEPFVRTGAPILVMSPESAELSKYAANAMLASRISFMNDIAALCEAVGADVDSVRLGVGSDRRIGSTFLFPGAGYGGSCFPKDVRSLVNTAQNAGTPFALFQEIERSNERQKGLLARKLATAFAREGGLAGKRIAVWGLAFKPGTDDLREAPSLVLISELLAAGAQVSAHDPVALERAAEVFAPQLASGNLELVPDVYQSAKAADALVLVTDWGDYRRPNLERLRKVLARPWVFDGRNVWDRAAFELAGFRYEGIGRGAGAALEGWGESQKALGFSQPDAHAPLDAQQEAKGGTKNKVG